MIYLDNAATTFPKPENVYRAMDKMNREGAVNAGRGSYKLAQEASKIIADTKSKIRQLVHLDTSAVVFAGHKTLYGPFGIGGFINVSGIKLNTFITGGTGSDSLNLDMPSGNESKYESASANIVAIAGLNAALESLDQRKCYEHEKELTKYLIERLSNNKKVKMYLPNDLENHIGIVSLTVDGFSSEDIGIILDEDFDIAVRTGYHCAPYIHKYLKDETQLGTVRVGIGQFNTKKEIDLFVKAIEEIVYE